MKDRVVIFSKSGGRILKGIDIEQYRNNPNALINPEIPTGAPPHTWRLRNGKIVVITQAEIDRESDLEAASVGGAALENSSVTAPKTQGDAPSRKWLWPAMVAFLAVAACAAYLLF